MKIAITGTSSGIGKETSSYLKSFGYQILEINRQLLDLNDIESVKNFDLSGFNVLINNAGHELGINTRFDQVSTNFWLGQMNVNLLAPMMLTHNFLSQNSSGLIINVTSGIVGKYRPNSVPYFVSKSALSLFTEAVQVDMKDNFRFVEVIPKRINTGFATKNGADSSNSDYLIEPIEVAKNIKYVIENEFIQKITVSHSKRC